MGKSNLLIAQGGGPTAVINCSLIGAIEESKKSNNINKIIGALHSIDGLVKEELIDLGLESPLNLKQIYQAPGAALGSCRRKMQEEDCSHILEVFKKSDVRYFLYNGGNDSMHTAHSVEKLARSIGYELFVIGIPKTIDNDLAFTDHCPGYGSAARYIATVTREIGMDIASLPTPVSVIETMGRNAGWIAAASAFGVDKEGDAPNLIYFPEITFNMDSFLLDIEELYRKWGRAIAVVSEGIKDETGQYLGGIRAEAAKDEFGWSMPGGAAAYLSAMVSEKLKLRARSEKPGLAGRTSVANVSVVDQEEAYLAGQTAVKAAIKGKSGVMITLQRESERPYKCTTGEAPLEKVADTEKLLPEEFINSKKNFVTEGFIEYCRPLIGGPINSFARFKGHKLVL